MVVWVNGGAEGHDRHQHHLCLSQLFQWTDALTLRTETGTGKDTTGVYL